MQKNTGKNIKGRSYPASEPFEPHMLEFLKDPDEARAYLKSCLEDGEPHYFLVALNQVAKANGGFSQLARKTGLSRENLYSALSPNGNPKWNSINAVLNSLGLRISLEPALTTTKKSRTIPAARRMKLPAKQRTRIAA